MKPGNEHSAFQLQWVTVACKQKCWNVLYISDTQANNTVIVDEVKAFVPLFVSLSAATIYQALPYAEQTASQSCPLNSTTAPNSHLPVVLALYLPVLTLGKTENNPSWHHSHLMDLLKRSTAALIHDSLSPSSSFTLMVTAVVLRQPLLWLAVVVSASFSLRAATLKLFSINQTHSWWALIWLCPYLHTTSPCSSGPFYIAVSLTLTSCFMQIQNKWCLKWLKALMPVRFE